MTDGTSFEQEELIVRFRGIICCKELPPYNQSPV
jgi:hypothetical protein